MPLQIRITHALGGQIVDVPDRPAEQAFAIGRANGVDLQIPSASVAPRQLSFFVHDGYWFVQDHSGAGTTFVNQQPIAEPQALQIGDVVHAGAGNGAATIEVSPSAAAAGYSGYVAAAVVQQAAPQPATSYAQPRPTSAPRVPPRHMRQAGEAPMPAGYTPPAGYAGQQYAEPAPADDLSSVAQSTSSYSPRRPRKKDNTAMIMVIVVAAVLIIGGTALAIMLINKSRATPPPAPPPAPKKEPPRPDTRPKRLFGLHVPQVVNHSQAS